jgi:hypothetical protein
VLVNGSAAAFAGPGLSVGMAYGQRGENRVEARVVQGAGKPGTWRFELGSTANLVPGSLRVLAGSVTEVSGDALVFRLSGRPGERVMFTFRTSNYCPGNAELVRPAPASPLDGGRGPPARVVRDDPAPGSQARLPLAAAPQKKAGTHHTGGATDAPPPPF